MKKCSKCKINKELNEFNKNKSKKDGLMLYCKECKKESAKKYYENNKDKVKTRVNEYYQSNKEVCIERMNSYKERNLDKVREYKNNYQKRRKAEDPLYHLIHNVRCSVYKAVKRIGEDKKFLDNNGTFEILKCSPTEFKTYIESLFEDGMSWSNQGEWHLDHRKPISWANNIEEVLELNHYTNFKPMWSRLNQSKGNKFED